jgi:hypothetical protein
MFLDQLPVVGSPVLLRGAVLVAILTFVVGSGLGLWLALSTGGDTPARKRDDLESA